MQTEQTAQKKRFSKGRVFMALALIVCVILVVIAAATFVDSFHYLQENIGKERENYLQELTTQMTVKVSTAVKQKEDAVLNYANLINQVKPETFETLQQIFSRVKDDSPMDRILLISEEGKVYLLSGNTVRIHISDFVEDLVSSGGMASAFSPLGSSGDFWFFGTGMNRTCIEGIPMVAVVRAYSNELIADELTSVLLDKQASSFLLSATLNILAKPSDANFVGSNLLSSLENQGMDEALAEEVKDSVLQKESCSVTFSMNGIPYLIQVSQAEDDYFVAVLMNMDIATADTMKAMTRTMLLVVILLVAILLIAFGAIAFAIVTQMRNREAAQKRQLEMQALEIKSVREIAEGKTAFLAKMSHDIRTPLNGIIGMLYLAKQNMEKPEEMEDDLNKAQTSANYLLSLVNDILDMSKISSDKLQLNPEPGNVEALIDHITSIFSTQVSEKHIQMRVSRSESFNCSYLYDKMRMQQILTNLVSNAIKFTEYGGHIDLDVSAKPLDAQHDMVAFCVADDGRGMNEAFLERLGQPFEQATLDTAQKYGGSGLGLSIVKSLVQLMNGKLEVTSKEGQGSRFTISMPLIRHEKVAEAAKQPVVQAASSAAAQDVLTGRHVLLVEDHPINAQIAIKVLSKWGIKVTLAENGQLGYEAFEKSVKGEYDLIFMDIQMPIMNGYEATQAIRQMSREDARTIPIFAMSANAFDEDVRKSLSVGMNGHIRKPLNIPDLKAVLMKQFEEVRHDEEV